MKGTTIKTIYLALTTLLLLTASSLFAQYKEIQNGGDGFVWYLIKGDGYEGAQDIHGNTIIPLSRHYHEIIYIPYEESGFPPYFYVGVNDKWGVCTRYGEEIIKPKYVSLNYIAQKGGFVYRDNKNSDFTIDDFKPLGIALDSNGKVVKNSNNIANNQVKNLEVWDDELIVEEDGFRWIETTAIDLDALARGEDEFLHGAKDVNGKEIIPLSRGYRFVNYSNEDSEGYPPYFEVSQGFYRGACTIDGRVIVAPVYGSVHYDLESDVFVFQEYKVDPVDMDSDEYLERLYANIFNDNTWYSLGVSLNKKGEPYLSNKTIVSYSDYYTPYTPPKTSNSSNNNSYSSKNSNSTTSAPILNGDNLATGIVTVLAGAFIVAGIYDLFGGSSSSSSSSSSNNNNTVASNPNNVMSMGNVVISRADLYEHNILTGKFDNIVMYLRNNNNHDVFVNVEMMVNGTWKPCRITYEEGARTEPLNGSYSDDGDKEIHLRGNATRVVEVTSYSGRRPSAIRITNVH